MPLPAVWDPKSGTVHLNQVNRSDADSDTNTTAKRSGDALSVSSSDMWPGSTQQNAEQVTSRVEQPQEASFPDECRDYLAGKCMNGENCPLKHYGFDAKGNKKQVCLGFTKGYCTYGLKCKFLHHAFDRTTGTWREACVQHANYKCTRGDECPLLHVVSRKKNKSDMTRSRGTAPPRQDVKSAGYPVKQESPNTAWNSPQEKRSLRLLNRAAIQNEVLKTRAEILLIRLNYAVGIDGMLGMLSWCGMDPYMFDLVLPAAETHEHGVIRFTAPEHAARFVEACDIPGNVCCPAVQSIAVLLREFVDRLPPNLDPSVLLIRDNGRKFVHLRVYELLEMLRREPISTPTYPENGMVHGGVISEPRLKDCLNRPRTAGYDMYDGSTQKSDGGIRLADTIAVHRGRRTHG